MNIKKKISDVVVFMSENCSMENPIFFNVFPFSPNVPVFW